MEFLEKVPELLTALLATLGGLRLLSRYTPWKWDDKAFEAAEKPVKWAAAFVKKYWPKPAPKDEEKK